MSEDDFIHSKNKKYKFYMITPFVVSIRKWIAKFKAAKNEGKDRSRAGLRVTMDEEEAANDSEADLLNQAVSEQHHFFYQQQNPHIDQYSSAMVPQTQRVEMEESLKSLLGMGGGYSHHQQEQQSFSGSHSYSQPLNIPLSHPHHQGYGAAPPPSQLVGSFPHQQPHFGSFGHGHLPPGPGMFYTSPIPPPNNMLSHPPHMLGENQSYPPRQSPQDDQIPQQHQQPMFDMDASPEEQPAFSNSPVQVEEETLETVDSSEEIESGTKEITSISPDRQRKTALLDILMGSTPPENDSSLGLPSSSVATAVTSASSAQPLSPKKTSKQLEKQAQQNALMDLLLTGGTREVDGNADAPIPATAASVSSKSQKGGAKKEKAAKAFSTAAPSSSSDVDSRKSPKKKKKDRVDGSAKDNSVSAPTSGLQFGAVQILKRPVSSPSSSGPPKSSATEESEQKEEPINILKKKDRPQQPEQQRNEKKKQQQPKPTPTNVPTIKTAAAARQDSSSQLLELINSTRKNSAAENQSLLDVLFHGSSTNVAASKSSASLAEDDPGLEMALSGRTMSRSSSIASSARVTSPTPGGAVLKERPSLVDILKGVPLPPSSSSSHYPQNLDYARSLSPTSPKVRALSPVRPSIMPSALPHSVAKSPKNGLLDILLGGPVVAAEPSKLSTSADTSASAKSPLSPSQQSLIDILQGVPNPKPPGSSLTDAFAAHNPSIVTSGSSVSAPPNNSSTNANSNTSKKEGKSSLMDILLGGFK